MKKLEEENNQDDPSNLKTCLEKLSDYVQTKFLN